MNKKLNQIYIKHENEINIGKNKNFVDTEKIISYEKEIQNKNKEISCRNTWENSKMPVWYKAKSILLRCATASIMIICAKLNYCWATCSKTRKKDVDASRLLRPKRPVVKFLCVRNYRKNTINLWISFLHWVCVCWHAVAPTHSRGSRHS